MPANVCRQPLFGLFDRVRILSAEDIIKRYSPTEPQIKSGHAWFHCPFHDDSHPSLKAKGKRWRCFACGAWGDGVDYVARLYALTPKEAAQQIARDFGLADNSPVSKKQRETIEKEIRKRQAKKAFDEVVEQTYRQLCDVRIECCRIIDLAGEYGLRFSHVPDLLDMYLDILQFGTDAEKRNLLKEGVVQRWIKVLGNIESPE